MVFRRLVIVSCVVLFVVGMEGSQFRDAIDLSSYLRDPVLLNKLVVEYDNNSSHLLFVYGNGKVIRQAQSINFGDLVPTCKGEVKQDRIRELLRGFIDHRLFDLPQKSYLIMLAVEDPAKEMQLHSIIFDDGVARAQRSFAYGVYAGKKEPVPADFSESEKLLQQLEHEAIGTQPCGVAPRIELPKVDSVAPRPSPQQPKL
ncbi:MAG: hypothetical protein ACM3JB_04775 [Acidobacteriaceae bacterium]